MVRQPAGWVGAGVHAGGGAAGRKRNVDPEGAGTSGAAAYVFERDQGGSGNWGEVTKLNASQPQAMDHFGTSVAVSDDTAIVGADGKAYVLKRDQGSADSWSEVRKLTAGAETNTGFGAPVSIAGDTAIVCGGGAAYVFERYGGPGNDWGPVLKLPGSEGSFGFSVMLAGDAAIIGAYGENGVGAAHVFERAAWAYVLDLYGGLHPAGPNAAAITPMPYFYVDAARDVELSPSGAYVPEGYGGVFSAGGEPPLIPSSPYFGFDIGRDLELAADGGGYVLDGFGGVHALGGAPVLSPATPYFGIDVARDLELRGGGYYVMDSNGGLHAGGEGRVNPKTHHPIAIATHDGSCRVEAEIRRGTARRVGDQGTAAVERPPLPLFPP